MDLKKFCKLIKVEYSWFLYNYIESGANTENPRYLDFPYCCHLSANLISSYLNVHFDSLFKHYRFNKSFYPHSWSSNERNVVDFTIFQQEIDPEEKELFLKHKIINKNQFVELINKHDIYYKKEEYQYQVFNNMFIEWELYGVKYAECIKENALTLEPFMKYVKSAIKDVNSNISY